MSAVRKLLAALVLDLALHLWPDPDEAVLGGFLATAEAMRAQHRRLRR